MNGESRRAIQRSDAQLPDAFKIEDFDTKSTISWALEKCSEYKRARFLREMAEELRFASIFARERVSLGRRDLF